MENQPERCDYIQDETSEKKKQYTWYWYNFPDCPLLSSENKNCGESFFFLSFRYIDTYTWVQCKAKCTLNDVFVFSFSPPFFFSFYVKLLVTRIRVRG